MIRVLIADDQSLVRSGFALMLSAEVDIDVVGQARDGVEAVALARELQPDIILMDVQMPVMDGLAATEAILADIDTSVVVLTTFDRDDYLHAALSAGAAGFLLKNTEPEQLADAIRAVADGHALLAPEVTRRVIEQWNTGSFSPTPDPRVDTLTDRELDVLQLLGDGMSNAEIAAHLVVSETTIKTHVSNCLMKCGVRDRVQLVVFAYRNGLVQT